MLLDGTINNLICQLLSHINQTFRIIQSRHKTVSIQLSSNVRFRDKCEWKKWHLMKSSNWIFFYHLCKNVSGFVQLLSHTCINIDFGSEIGMETVKMFHSVKELARACHLGYVCKSLWVLAPDLSFLKYFTFEMNQ